MAQEMRTARKASNRWQGRSLIGGAVCSTLFVISAPAAANSAAPIPAQPPAASADFYAQVNRDRFAERLEKIYKRRQWLNDRIANISQRIAEAGGREQLSTIHLVSLRAALNHAGQELAFINSQTDQLTQFLSEQAPSIEQQLLRENPLINQAWALQQARDSAITENQNLRRLLIEATSALNGARQYGNQLEAQLARSQTQRQRLSTKLATTENALAARLAELISMRQAEAQAKGFASKDSIYLAFQGIKGPAVAGPLIGQLSRELPAPQELKPIGATSYVIQQR